LLNLRRVRGLPKSGNFRTITRVRARPETGNSATNNARLGDTAICMTFALARQPNRIPECDLLEWRSIKEARARLAEPVRAAIHVLGRIIAMEVTALMSGASKSWGIIN
jgi:hypothetical protein